MSKLQALAAARKKKAEEKNAVNDKMEQARMGVKELSVKDPLAERQNLPTAGPLSKRLKTSDSTSQDNTLPVFAANPTPSEPAQTEPAQPTVAATAPKDEPPLAKAQPSAFARTLFGSSSKSNAPKPLVDKPKVGFPFCVGQAPKPTAAALELGPAFEIQKRKRDDCDEYETTVVLYPNLPQFVRDNFAQPSPDDIVFAAQAKGKGSLLKKSSR
jgi:elongation factor 1 alpha-like protein